MANELVVTNNTFQQHPIRLYTWTSLGDRVRNQIDNMLIGRRWRTTILVTKTRPSADDCGSDYQLLGAKLKMKLRQKKIRSVPVRYDIDTITQEYMVAVTNRFAALLMVAVEEQTPNELWEEAKEVVNSAAKKHVSKRKKQKQPWLLNETLGVADERRQAKVTGDRGRWERLNKEFTKSARKHKNAYIESKCRHIEKDKTNSKKAFRTLKEVTGKRSARNDVINDTEGRVLIESVDILKRWEGIVESCIKTTMETITTIV